MAEPFDELLIGCRRELSPDGDVAVFSKCGRYRYLLTRGQERPVLGVVMLNPSTADAFRDDPTIRRIKKFAERWDYGGVLVGNLFAFRSSHPSDLRQADDPIGPLNDRWLRWILSRSSRILVAWGSNPLAEQQAKHLGYMAMGMGSELLCLRRTGSGAPIHPMARGRHRVPDDVVPKIWEFYG